MGLELRDIAATLKLYRSERKTDHNGAHQRAITYLEGQFSLADSEDDLSFLYQSIAGEHLLYGDVDRAKKTWEEILVRFPNDPLSWISASGFYLYEGSDPSHSLSLAESGCQIAEKVGRFVIHAHSTRCRAAKALNDYRSMNESIDFILSYKRPTKSMDSAYECDFLVGLPTGSVSDDKAEKLRALCKR